MAITEMNVNKMKAQLSKKLKEKIFNIINIHIS